MTARLHFLFGDSHFTVFPDLGSHAMLQPLLVSALALRPSALDALPNRDIRCLTCDILQDEAYAGSAVREGLP
jgi:hypothetical protein